MTDLFILANEANGWGGNLVCLVHEAHGGGALPTPQFWHKGQLAQQLNDNHNQQLAAAVNNMLTSLYNLCC